MLLVRAEQAARFGSIAPMAAQMAPARRDPMGLEAFTIVVVDHV
jgi:hypothetical protein